MLSKILIGAVLAGTVVLAGCSNGHKDIETVQTEVKVLDEKVEALQTDVTKLQQDTKIAAGEAARANQRLDNQVSTYRK